MYWWYYKEYLLSTGWTTGLIQDGSAMILSKWDCFHWTDYYWQWPIGNKWSINKINFKFEEDTHLHPVFLLSKYEYWCRFLHVPNKAMNGKTLKFSELSWRCYGKHHAVEKKDHASFTCSSHKLWQNTELRGTRSANYKSRQTSTGVLKPRGTHRCKVCSRRASDRLL